MPLTVASAGPDSSSLQSATAQSPHTARKRIRGQRGQGLTEYAVLVSLVAVACIAAMVLFGGALQGRIAAIVAAVAGEDRGKIDEGNKTAAKASERLRTRIRKVDGMKVNTDANTGEVIDSESLQ